jgi:hypothetical protein
MKRSLAALSLIAAFMVGGWLYAHNAAAGRRTAVADRSQASPSRVDDQEKCAEQAREEFRRAGWDRGQRAKSSDHYSATLKKCFIEFDLILADDRGDVDVIQLLSDADGREYATYAMAASRGGKQSETLPTVCEVALPSGEQIECSSLEQFSEYIKGYMDNSEYALRAAGDGTAQLLERLPPRSDAR